ncbi:hypothetical protein JCM8097_006839 [Rhodosporidiobolus ruineniae]
MPRAARGRGRGRGRGKTAQPAVNASARQTRQAIANSSRSDRSDSPASNGSTNGMASPDSDDEPTTPVDGDFEPDDLVLDLADPSSRPSRLRKQTLKAAEPDQSFADLARKWERRNDGDATPLSARGVKERPKRARTLLESPSKTDGEGVVDRGRDGDGPSKRHKGDRSLAENGEADEKASTAENGDEDHKALTLPAPSKPSSTSGCLPVERAQSSPDSSAPTAAPVKKSRSSSSANRAAAPRVGKESTKKRTKALASRRSRGTGLVQAAEADEWFEGAFLSFLTLSSPMLTYNPAVLYYGDPYAVLQAFLRPPSSPASSSSSTTSSDTRSSRPIRLQHLSTTRSTSSSSTASYVISRFALPPSSDSAVIERVAVRVKGEGTKASGPTQSTEEVILEEAVDERGKMARWLLVLKEREAKWMVR